MGGRLLLAAMLGLLAALPAPALAQVDSRLQRIEAQLRALQRQVFPGGDERFFEPEITPEGRPAQAAEAGASGGALTTSMLNRIEAIESQLARLTASSEENQNALAGLEARFSALEARAAAAAAGAAAGDAAIAASAAAPSAAASAAPPAGSAPAAASGGTGAPGRAGSPAIRASGQASGPPPAQSAPQSAPQPAAQSASQASAPSSDRLARVKAIAKPITEDRGEDEYVYGFRLWEAGFHPEAQQQLALFVENFPAHPRASFGRNLLGRAYLDGGDARRAATQFFENYQSNPQGARAGDSLLFLAEAMTQLGDTRRACIALAEFADTYPALATGRLADQYRGLVGRVACS